MNLSLCSACGGFVPRLTAHCPHCKAALRGRRLARLCGSGALALTLSACYGAAPRHYVVQPLTPRCDPALDVDGDGFCDNDCDEANPDIYPGAPDPEGDAVDQNCDGVDGIAVPNGGDPVLDTPDSVMAAP